MNMEKPELVCEMQQTGINIPNSKPYGPTRTPLPWQIVRGCV